MNLHEEISKVAQELYEKSGRIEDRDFENWHEAERIVMERYRSNTGEEFADKASKRTVRRRSKQENSKGSGTRLKSVKSD